MDTAAAIIRRKRAHQPIDAPDKGHIHHRLLAAGFTQEFTVFIMWAWTAMLAICGIVLAESDGMARVIAISLAAVVTAFAIYRLKLLDPVLKHYFNPRKSKRERQQEEDAKVLNRISRANTMQDRNSHATKVHAKQIRRQGPPYSEQFGKASDENMRVQESNRPQTTSSRSANRR